MIHPTIEHNIPVPPKNSGGKHKQTFNWSFFVRKLNVGDSFVHHHPFLFHAYFTRLNFGIATRQIEPKHNRCPQYRIWRTK